MAMASDIVAVDGIELERSQPLILGIDPGVSGALGFLSPSFPPSVEVFDVPVVAGVIDGRNLRKLLERRAPTCAVIEDVHSMPHQGVVSTFKFGRAFGTLVGVVEAMGLPLVYVSPRKWKRHFGLDANAEKSRRRALDRFPDAAGSFVRKKDHHRAEAALIALWAHDVVWPSSPASHRKLEEAVARLPPRHPAEPSVHASARDVRIIAPAGSRRSRGHARGAASSAASVKVEQGRG